MILVDAGRLCVPSERVIAMAVISLLQLATCMRTAAPHPSEPSAGRLAQLTCSDAIGCPCWRSCITYPLVLLSRAARTPATKPSVLNDSGTPAVVGRGA